MKASELIKQYNRGKRDFRGADLEESYLGDANLNYAIVKNAIFGYNQNVSEALKEDLKRRGAIFVDNPGSDIPSRVLIPH